MDSAKGSKSENIARAKSMILDARPTEGSLILLPEMFATGYLPASLDAAAENFSTNDAGETAHMLSEIADATNCTIMGAGITRAPDGFFNHVSIYEPGMYHIDAVRYTFSSSSPIDAEYVIYGSSA